MRFLFLTALLLLRLLLVAQTEQYSFSKLDIHNVLSHNQVNTILKDANGFIWFGTLSGLNRYDGYSCKVFRKTPNDSSSLTDNFISSLYELPEEKMWVTTKGPPCIYDSHTEKFDARCDNYL